jgi:hypothetical protein
VREQAGPAAEGAPRGRVEAPPPVLAGRSLLSVPYRVQFGLVALGLVAVVMAMLARLAAREWSKDLYYDEMWRADVVRTPDFLHRYVMNIAPAPPGWFLVLRVSGLVLPEGDDRLLRIQSLAFGVLMFLLIAVLLDRMLVRAQATSITRLVAAVSAPLVILFPAYANLAQYLNDYLFQAGCTVGVVVLWRIHDEWRFGRAALLVAIVLLPVITLSGLFLLPAIAIDLLRRDVIGVRASAGVAPLAGTLAAFAASGAVAVTVYLVFYRPVIHEEIRSYWAGSVLRDTPLREVLQTSWNSLMDASISWWGVRAFPHGYGGPVTAVLLLGLAFAGFFILGRLWVWFPIGFGSAGIAAVIASLAGWPMAPERVNVPWLWMFHTAVVVAVVYTAARLLRHPAAVVAVGAVLLLGFWPMPLPISANGSAADARAGGTYARGLTSDLQLVASSPDVHNIVISYHPMSHWYTDDRLINHSHPPRTFTVVGEPWHGAAPLYDDVDGVARRAGWTPNTAVWCVIPFEDGPEASARACHVGLPGLVKRVQVHGLRSNIIGWLP